MDQNPVYLLDESRSLGYLFSAVVAGCWVHPHAVAKATQTFSHAQSKHVYRMLLDPYPDPHFDGLSSKGLDFKGWYIWEERWLQRRQFGLYLAWRPRVCGAPRAVKPGDRGWSTTKAWGTVSRLTKRPMLYLFKWSHRLNVGEQAAVYRRVVCMENADYSSALTTSLVLRVAAVFG